MASRTCLRPSGRADGPGETIRVSDPTYGNQLSLDVTEIETDGNKIKFAVREVSNGVYLFALAGDP